MRKIIPVEILLLFFSTYIFSETIEKTYFTGEFTPFRSGSYYQIGFPDAYQSGVAGQPLIPWLNVALILPPGHEAESIEFTGHDLTALPGSFILAPRQFSRPLSDAGYGHFFMDKDVYNSNRDYPGYHTGMLTTGYLKGVSVAMSTVTPVIYQPASGKISYYQSFTIRIKTRPSPDAEAALLYLRPEKVFRNEVAMLAQNPEMLRSYSISPGKSDTYDMLIITSQDYKNSYQELIDLYRVRGISTRVVSTDSIYSSVSGTDNPEKIRNFIIQEYQNHGIQYVNLAGDAEIVPYRGFYCKVQSSSVYEDSNIPSDLYYSALDGNWNTDGDNYWAEIGEDDLLPELSVGRMTFSNQAELDILIHKTVSYQASPVEGEFRKPLMAGEYLYNNPLTYGCDYLDLLKGTRNENGYTTVGYPEDYNIQWMCDEDATWSKSQLMSMINGGTQFIHHAGHANQNYVMRFNLTDVSDANFSQVNGINHNYALVYTHGCICGAFDYSDCIAERFLNINNFAVAGAFNSRYGWFNEGTTEGPSAHLHREFVDALYDDKENHIGTAHLLSKIKTSPWVNAPGQWEEGALRWCFYDCNILGDPALGIWTDEPITIETMIPESIYAGDTAFFISVTTAGIPVEGLNCLLMNNGIVLSQTQTGQTGNAAFSFAAQEPETLLVYISGYNCRLHEYPVVVRPSFKVSGVVHYADSLTHPVGNVLVTLQDGEFTEISNQLTTNNGVFQFDHLPPGDYRLTLSFTSPWLGCNATDALLISLHSVMVPGFILTGLKLAAGDVNNNGIVNATDGLMVLQRTVDIIHEFGIPDWVTEEYLFTISDSDIEINPEVICAGDVNGSD